MKNDLNQRVFHFVVKCLKYLKTLPDSSDFRIIKYQLVKSATSSDANYEEAQAGSSRADFNNKVRIALREMRESNYWLRIIKNIEDKQEENKELNWLLNESVELKNILGSIVQKTRKFKDNASNQNSDF